MDKNTDKALPRSKKNITKREPTPSFRSIKNIHRSKTGKASHKWASYIDYYDSLFAPLRNAPISLLEIGVANGGSLETWAEYFHAGKHIVGCDIEPKCGSLVYADPRIKVVIGDANSTPALQSILNISPEFDLIIDDGSHVATHILNAFLNYFPLVKPGGLFVIEDTHACYQDGYGGGILNENGPYAFFKKLIDITNFQFWRSELSINTYLRTLFPLGATPGFILEGWVESLEFRNSIITIRKASSPGHEKLGESVYTGQDKIL